MDSAEKFSIIYCKDDNGKPIFLEWLKSLSDKKTEARIAAAVVRLENGNFGHSRFVGNGVWEVKLDFGPGYRVYYSLVGTTVVLLLGGGSKKTQQKDIELAQERLKEHKHNAH